MVFLGLLECEPSGEFVGVGFPGHGGGAGRDGQASDPNGLDPSTGSGW